MSSYYFVMLVLHDVSRLHEVMLAWEEAGVGGVTVIATSGLGRIRNSTTALREDLPLIPNLSDLLNGQHEEMFNRTMFSIVEGDALVDRIVKATESVLGDLNKPRNGIIAVLPIARVHGLRPPWRPEDDEMIDDA